MDRRSVGTASAVALALFAGWWGAILALDGWVASTFPYREYVTIALLYPEVYYPALPGWILAQAQPFAWGVWGVALGWMLVLSVAIGAAATKVAAGRAASPAVTAGAAVVGLFVLFTVVEAVGSLVA